MGTGSTCVSALRRLSAAAALSVLLLALIAAPAVARPGQLDRSFGRDGIGGGTLGPHYPETGFYAVAEQPDGTILGEREGATRLFSATGVLQAEPRHEYRGLPPARAVQADGKVLEVGPEDRVARFTADGAPDPSFHGGVSEPAGIFITALLPLPSGKILVAGPVIYEILLHGSTYQVGLARLNADGTLDKTFAGGGRLELRRAYGIRAESLIGLAPRPGEGAAVVLPTGVVGFDSAGNFDPGYGVEGIAPLGKVSVLAFDPGADGALAVAGATGPVDCCAGDQRNDFFVAHLDPGGRFDPRFSGGTGMGRIGPAQEHGDAALFAPDGSVVVAGHTRLWYVGCKQPFGCHDESIPALARFDAAGNPDAGFGSDGLLRVDALGGAGADAAVSKLVERRAGGLLAAGSGGPYGSVSFLAAVSGDGHLDPGFGREGVVTERDPEPGSLGVTDVGVGPRGEILVAGWSDAGAATTAALLRYTRNGRLDRRFGGGDGNLRLNTREGIRAIAVDPRGGAVLLMSGQEIVRVSPRGTVPSAFRHPPSLVETVPTADFDELALQPDGKILVAGTDNGRARRTNMFVARLMPNGGLDHGFGDDGYTTLHCPLHGRCRAHDILVAHDGGILLAGKSSGGATYPPESLRSRAVVARLLPDGRPDPGFGGNGLSSPRVTRRSGALTVAESGGRIIVGGGALPRQGGSGFLAAFDASGRLDRSFGRRGVARAFPHDTSAKQVVPAGGRLVVLTAGRGAPLVAFHLDGSPDRSFARPSLPALARKYSRRTAVIQGRDLVVAWNQGFARTRHRPSHYELRLARIKTR
jgi:uncharacterized delta-60 repeat protein